MQMINYGSAEFVFCFGFMFFLCLFLSDGLLYLLGSLTKALTRAADSSGEQRHSIERETHEMENNEDYEDFDDSNYPMG